MSDDATLDAFAGADEERADELDSGASEEEPPDQPEPPSLTFTSSPDGDTCAECGETVQRRWRAGEGADDPDALVCPDCKEW